MQMIVVLRQSSFQQGIQLIIVRPDNGRPGKAFPVTPRNSPLHIPPRHPGGCKQILPQTQRDGIPVQTHLRSADRDATFVRQNLIRILIQSIKYRTSLHRFTQRLIPDFQLVRRAFRQIQPGKMGIRLL